MINIWSHHRKTKMISSPAQSLTLFLHETTESSRLTCTGRLQASGTQRGPSLSQIADYIPGMKTGGTPLVTAGADESAAIYAACETEWDGGAEGTVTLRGQDQLRNKVLFGQFGLNRQPTCGFWSPFCTDSSERSVCPSSSFPPHPVV